MGSCFGSIVRSGEVIASPFIAHAVHVEVSGLQPDRPYWYRFRSGGVESPVGRSRTAPAYGSSVAKVRFAVAGCQNYEAGLYTAYRHLVAEQPDFVFCYGDYIYENGGRPAPASTPALLVPRRHTDGEILSVDDYRRRYAQYKMDPDLQAAHAAAPWFVTWDDHETDNNWAAEVDEKATAPDIFLLRRQAAAQAYYEHMPLRRSSLPYGPHIQLYRQALYGDLINLNLLDTRQYRSNQPCNDQGAGCTDLSSAPNMLGGEQEAWLKRSLSGSKARWNVLAQQVMMMDLDRDPTDAFRANIDSWAGYRLPRTRLLEHIRDSAIPNVVVLTGDEHVNYAGELHIDGGRPGPKPLAVEFVATSISSSGDGQDQSDTAKGVLSVNPQLKFINQQRGYVVCDVTPDRWEATFRVMDKVSAPDGVVSTRARFVVESGAQSFSDG
jgi:alkaline phosphatase D